MLDLNKLFAISLASCALSIPLTNLVTSNAKTSLASLISLFLSFDNFSISEIGSFVNKYKNFDTFASSTFLQY